ncbi:MAG TPA: hypothetical protein VJ577_13985 [Burkholderiaceae bacterium]|nr:hypothetical protein [Burkholderiaceae bacterium]
MRHAASGGIECGRDKSPIAVEGCVFGKHDGDAPAKHSATEQEARTKSIDSIPGFFPLQQVRHGITPLCMSVPIVAKLDRGYRNAEGVIILAELKTRHRSRPYLTDVIELSAQRLAVEAQTGERVADYGFVLVKLTESKRKMAYRVELLSEEKVVALTRRRKVIMMGEALPRYAAV